MGKHLQDFIDKGGFNWSSQVANRAPKMIKYIVRVGVIVAIVWYADPDLIHQAIAEIADGMHSIMVGICKWIFMTAWHELTGNVWNSLTN